MNQTLIERYIGLRLLRTFLVVTLVFTLVVWLIQTLNLIDNIGGKGTTIIGFLGISLLGIPSLLTYILPPALLLKWITRMEAASGKRISWQAERHATARATMLSQLRTQLAQAPAS